MRIFPESDSSIILESGESIEYNELMKTTRLIEDEIETRTHILCLFSNDIGSLLGYFTFAYGDNVPLILSVETHKDHILRIVDSYSVPYIWMPCDYLLEEVECTHVIEVYGYKLVRIKSNSIAPVANDLALLASTSGSTGSPKFVRQSYQNIVTNTSSICKYLELNSDDTAITSLPISYTFGMSTVNCQVLVGGDIVLTGSSVVQKEFWQLVEKHDVQVLSGVPFTYETIDKMRAFRKELPSITKILQAGGRLSPHLQAKIAKYCEGYGKEFYVMYGQTEATTRMSYLPPANSLFKLGSIGIAVPGGQFDVVDLHGNSISTPFVVGELVYRGENVCLGYAEVLEDLKAPNEWLGKLETGDLAEFDEDGYFYIKGRIKRIHKHYGLRVNLDEVEMLIRSRYPSLSVACVGDGEDIVVWLEDKPMLEELKKYLLEATQIKPSGLKLRQIEVIPKLKNEKINYQALMGCQ